MTNKLKIACLAGLLAAVTSASAFAEKYTIRVPMLGLNPKVAQEEPIIPVGLSTSTISFGSVAVGGAASDKVTLTNTSKKVTPVSIGTLTAPFSVASTNCGSTLDAGLSCDVNLSFKPTLVQTYTGSSLKITSGTPSSEKGIALEGTGAIADPYFANVSLLLHMNGVNNGTAFKDVKGTALTSSGAYTKTDVVKFGTAAVDTSGGYISAPSSVLDLRTATTFTIEYWIYRTGTQAIGYSLGFGSTQPVGGNNDWSFGLDTSNRATWYTYNGAGRYITGTSTIPLNTWTHLAVSVSSGNVKVFVNGIQEATGTLMPPSAIQTEVVLGQFWNRTLPARIDDLRVTRGVARYSSNFAVPVIEYPNN